MFDIDSDMFKPIIGARLLRDEAQRQTDLKKPEENQTVEGQAPELGDAATIPGVRTETPNIIPNGRNKEIR